MVVLEHVSWIRVRRASPIFVVSTHTRSKGRDAIGGGKTRHLAREFVRRLHPNVKNAEKA